MGNSIIRGKKSTNARQKKMMEMHAIDEMDLAFCDLVLSGWDEKLAAFYAYSLTNDNDSSINTFIRNQKIHHPGINSYLNEMEELKQSDIRGMQRKAMEMKAAAFTLPDSEYDLKTKTGMLDYLVDLSSTPGLDVKTKTDLAKQISDLMQFKKEEIKEEDNRINFYLPITCKYCELLKKALKNV